jgi:hypothetical protein
VAVAQAPQACAVVGAEGKSPAWLATGGRGWQAPPGEAEGRSGSPVGTCGTERRFTESRDGFRLGLGTDGVVVHCSHPGEPAPVQCALSKPSHPLACSTDCTGATSGGPIMFRRQAIAHHEILAIPRCPCR